MQLYSDRFTIPYIDEILVYSDTRDEHVRHVKMVLNALKRKKLKIKTEKCRFHAQEVEAGKIWDIPSHEPIPPVPSRGMGWQLGGLIQSRLNGIGSGWDGFLTWDGIFVGL